MKYVYIFILIFLLVGCTASNEDLQSEEPYPLIITVNEEKLPFQAGGYSWSYKQNGQITHVTTDHAAPNQMVSLDNVPPLSIHTPLTIEAIAQPTISFNIWDAKKIIATYESFEDIQERGPFIIELVAKWTEGEATYVAGFQLTD